MNMSRHKALLSDILRENPQLSEIEISEITGLTFNEIQACLLSMAQSAKQACLPKTSQVLCIGGANVDRKIQAVQTLIYGSSNPARSSISCGGVARNVAENLGRLGCSPSLLSFIGNDAEGQWLIGKTKEFVNIHSVGVVDGKSTGTYTAILDMDGEMAVALADMEIYDDVDIDLLQSKWAADFRTDLIVIDTNFPADVLEKIINRANETGTPLCIAPVSAPKIRKLPASLNGVAWLIANQSEAEALSGSKIKSEGDFFKVAEKILETGVERVVITRGDKGLIYFTKSGEAGVLLPPVIPVLDVTGAGDALIAGILYAFLKGLDIESCCKIGTACSIITLQSYETVNPALNSQELQETFRKYFSKGVTQH